MQMRLPFLLKSRLGHKSSGGGGKPTRNVEAKTGDCQDSHVSCFSKVGGGEVTQLNIDE